ncbi:MAG TPA: hypothetical protein VF039_09000 [Longimicrobiales bacterium]
MSRVRLLDRSVRSAFVLLSVPFFGACAGSTLGSGVGDRLLEEPPYVAGRLIPVDSQALGVLPIGYQRGATQPESFEPGANPSTPLGQLLQEMNTYLDSLDVGPLLVGVSLPGRAPDVMFRCETDGFDECVYPEGGPDPRMRLAVARPADEWRAALTAALDQAGARHALLISIELSDYWTYQRNLRGSKEVRLGTNNHVDVPWLTSLETPVSVLQLTGAIVDRDGKAVRIAAEGLIARRTNIVVSAIGGQALISDDDVEHLRELRRDDLPGEPLAWQVALRTLVGNLTGQIESARR